MTIVAALQPTVSRASHASPEQSVVSIPIQFTDRTSWTVMTCKVLSGVALHTRLQMPEF